MNLNQDIHLTLEQSYNSGVRPCQMYYHPYRSLTETGDFEGHYITSFLLQNYVTMHLMLSGKYEFNFFLYKKSNVFYCLSILIWVIENVYIV